MSRCLLNFQPTCPTERSKKSCGAYKAHHDPETRAVRCARWSAPIRKGVTFSTSATDPSDLLPLTPGHFLIGRPLTALPTDCYEQHVTGTLSRYQHLEQLRQHFWRRWSKEYISELQLRTKWRSDLNPLQEGVLVILKEDNLPPLKWRLGRVVAVHPGADGVSRVADVRTATGVVRRAFSKICPLPQDDI
ncbi:uncharacterized protein LOC123723320 [Papilio machaon]|uniref:uncharacterized protein LOC123723320 n=1 Tax=Papilio machaon TaxID=76193 RepID=UPI001E665E5E|nr:uncharacterized protein LOC123723320 [Papilio machaon]